MASATEDDADERRLLSADPMSRSIAVLVVDNERDFAELVASMLERERNTITVTATTSADDALSRLDAVDCIVSDYEMPGQTGLELLERVREVDPERPFILFTGRGSEEVASEAIAAGVTHYLQKKPGREQYAILANQIVNAVGQYRAERELRDSTQQYERTLAALHETSRDLMRAERKTDIYRLAVDTAASLLDVFTVRAYAFDPSTSRLESVAATGDLSTVEVVERPDCAGEQPVWDVFTDGETAYHADVRKRPGAPDVRYQSELLVPFGSHGVLLAGCDRLDGFDETMIELCHVLAANTEAALDRAERETLLREHDRKLTRQNEELTRLNHLNEIVRGIALGIAKASTCEEIETAVCDRLAATDRYRFAWTASTDDPPEPTAWAGVDPAYIDRIREDGHDAPEVEVIEDALETGSVLVRNVLETDRWASRRKEALTYGFQTVLVVPIADGNRQYGALLVHAAGIDSIDESERKVFDELGERVGYALRAVERTRAMLTDDRIEIELECADERLLLNRLSTRVDGPVSVDGVIERSDGTIVVFVRSRASADDLAALEEWATIEGLSISADGDEDAVLEVAISPTPFLEQLRSYDVHLSGATAQDGTAELVLAVPRRVDTRSLVESIRTAYPETELRARRECPSATTGSVRTQLEDRLTDRQFEAIKAAYYSGFFEWPRESTGEDLAGVLEVSPPTYHYHLRAAQRKLVALAFEGTSN